ncbi:MAG: TonB-dependent receptor [Bradyrhizobiaceae bacterium]|nr:TonB-dependent receptor [Bradyrhizobiaceae bacterium]
MHRWRIPTLVFLIMAFAGLTSAQDADTSRGIVKPPVEVTATADTIDLARSAIDRTVLTAQELRAKAPYQLQESLSDVPGLFVRQYGGLGGLAAVSVRGGSAAQTLVLLDGIQLNTVQSGMVDVATIPMAMIKRIDVQRGALGAVNGANAMTGCVDIRLGIPQTGLRLQASSASFNSWKGALVGAWNADEFAVGGGAEMYASDGSYEYEQEVDGTLIPINRKNGSVRSASMFVRAEGPHSTRLTMIARQTSRGVPGAVVPDVIPQTRAAFDEVDVLGTAGRAIVNTSALTLRADVAMRYLDQRYADPDATITGTSGIDARFLARDCAGYATMHVHSTTINHTIKAQYGFADLRGTFLQAEAGDYVHRQQIGLGYRAEWQSEHVSAVASARADVYGDVGGALSGGVGAAWLVRPQLTLRGHLGTGFRPPAFSELYFLNYGNIHLKPERTVMTSIGIHWRQFEWLVADASMFASTLTNLIVSVPVSPMVTSAMNIGSARSLGLEFGSTAHAWNERFTASWSYTVQDVRDYSGRAGIDGTPIVYVPSEMISAHVQWKETDVMGRLEWSYTGFRYAQAGGEATSLLAPYHLVNAVLGTTIHARSSTLNLQLRIDNLFDVRYAVVRGYPMPGTMMRLVSELVL